MYARSRAKNTTPQRGGAALPDKYKTINKTKNTTHSVVAIIGEEGQPGPSVQRGPVRLPNEILQNLSFCSINFFDIFHSFGDILLINNPML